jgi:hypothetical protein
MFAREIQLDKDEEENALPRQIVLLCCHHHPAVSPLPFLNTLFAYRFVHLNI